MHFDRAAETNNPNLTTLLEGKELLNGFNVSANYNFHKYAGVVFDYSAHFREDEFNTTFSGQLLLLPVLSTPQSTTSSEVFRSRTMRKMVQNSSRSDTALLDGPFKS
jgi:hypothetical protein